MHGDVISFYVEPDNQHVIMTVANPDNQHDTVRVPKTWLTAMTDAERDPYHTVLGDDDEHRKTGAFFAGSGGDGTVMEALTDAGWRVTWAEASYYYVMTAPDGSSITYIEGDIERGDTH